MEEHFIMIKSVSKFSLLFTSVLLFSGCGATIGNISAYQPCTLDSCDVMPSAEQLKSAKPKVVVFDFNENEIATAENAKLGRTIPGHVETQLTEGKAIELVDRKVAEKLQQEIMMAEMEGTSDYEGPAVADFAISGTIDNSGFTSRFQEAYTTQDKKGNTYYHQAKFIYTAEVKGKIKIYEIPSLRVVKTIPFSDNSQRSEETRSSMRPQTRDDELVRKAAADGIKSARLELKNFFAKKGFILEKRAKDNDTIFKVSLGSDGGMRSGDTCQIFTIKKNFNPITQEETLEEFCLGEGKVSEQVGPNYAWLVVKEDQLQEAPRLGDIVKIQYEKGLGDVLNSTGKLLNSIAQ